MRQLLPFKVEYLQTTGGGGQFYTTIAAFDCQPAAVCYAQACSVANPMVPYRVKKGQLLVGNYMVVDRAQKRVRR